MEPLYDPPAPATKEQKELIDKENYWRNLFADNPQHQELKDPHLGLINVFQNPDLFNYQQETEEEKKVPKILTQARQVDLQGPAIVGQSDFHKNWKEFTQGCFDGLNWENVFAAGGAVLGCLTAGEEGYRGSDIDLFIHGIENEQEANQKFIEVYNLILKNAGGKGDVIRTNRAVTILCTYPFRHVQIILRLYRSPGEVLLGFDIDSCCVGFDGSDLWCMERFRRALTKRYNLVNTSRRSVTYESRLFKYSKRGFAVAIPNLDKAKVTPSIFTKSIRNAQGLQKLLIYDYLQTTGRSLNYRHRRDDAEGSDYNNDLSIPWGPEWQPTDIINNLNIKNKAKFFSSINKNKKDKSNDGKQAQSKPYNHLFTCNAEKLKAGNFTLWTRSLDGKDVQNPLTWVKDNPAYQDYDNGFKRLMTGSFEPILSDDWTEGVYIAEGEEGLGSGQEPLLSLNSGSSKDKPKTPLHKGLGLVPLKKEPKLITTKPNPLSTLSINNPTSMKLPPSSKPPNPISTQSKIKPTGQLPTFSFGQNPNEPKITTATSSFAFKGFQEEGPKISDKSAKLKSYKEERASKHNEPGILLSQPVKEPISFEQTKSRKYESLPKPTKAEPKQDYFSAAAYILSNTQPTTNQPQPLHIGQEYLQELEGESFELGPQPGSTISDPYFNTTPQKTRAKADKKSTPETPKRKNIEFPYEPATNESFGTSTFPSTPVSDIYNQPPIQQQPQFGVPSQNMHPLHMPQSFPINQPPIQQQPQFGVPSFSQTQPMNSFSQYQQFQPSHHLPHHFQLPPLQQQPQPIPSMPSRISTIPQEQITAAKNSQHTKLLLVIALCSKQGSISMDEKGKLKDLVISGNPVLLSALEVFEIDQDLEELVDTLRRICKFL